MKGFFKRDAYLMLVNTKFYLICILVLGVLFAAGKTGMSFLGLYVIAFVASTLLSLFSYDEQNGWGAYAAAVPGGRKAQVDARYLVALTVALAATVLQGMMYRLSGADGQWAILPLYTGMILLYISLLFPLTYRFGNKSRLIMLAFIALMGGVAGAGGAILHTPGSLGGGDFPLTAASVPLLAVGVVAVAVSHRVSLAIVRRQEW